MKIRPFPHLYCWSSPPGKSPRRDVDGINKNSIPTAKVAAATAAEIPIYFFLTSVIAVITD